MSKHINNEYVLDCIKEWGNHCSVAFLDPECQFFSIPGINGIIGYRNHANRTIIFGDPASELQDQLTLMQAFKDHCNQNRKSIICIGTSEPFTNQLLQQKICSSAITIGNEIILDSTIDPKSHRGGDGSSLRNKWRYSIRSGLAVHEYKGDDTVIEQQLQQLHNLWHAHRKGPQIYLAQTDLFQHRKHRRWFYATHQNSIVGLVVITQLKAHEGFVINFLMLLPDAPTTTSEFIIMSVLEQLAQEGTATLSAGLIPKAELSSVYGFSSLSQLLIKQCYRIIHKRYRLHRKDQYWRKFAPHKKELFVLFEQPRVKTGDILGILHALHAL